MSEWFKEHDWKSCDGGDSSGGSNPLLCASKKPALRGLFCCAEKEFETSGIPRRSREEAAQHGAMRPAAAPSADDAFKAHAAEYPLLCAKRV